MFGALAVGCMLVGVVAGCGPDALARSQAGETGSPVANGELAAGTEPRMVGPYLQDLSTTSAAISWETDVEGSTWLEYGLTTAYGKVVSGGQDTGMHEVRLSDLSPATTYHYRVHCSLTTASDNTFVTADNQNSAIRFAVYGDTQANPEIHREVSNAILAEGPAFVLHVGDEVDDGRDYDSWNTEFFSPARKLISRVPVYAALGNHEHNADWFYYYHSYPAPENYYSFQWGSHLILVLDSTTAFDEESTQGTWLRTTLRSKQAREASWIWATFHFPAYAAGWTPCNYDGELNVREQLLPLLEQYGVDAVFNGHVHGYERGMKDGIYQVTTGGGGGGLDRHCVDWPHIRVTDYEHHYVVVESDDSKAVVRAKRPDGSIIDEFTFSRRERQPPRVPEAAPPSDHDAGPLY